MGYLLFPVQEKDILQIIGDRQAYNCAGLIHQHSRMHILQVRCGKQEVAGYTFSTTTAVP